jgi:hypothetical protein
MIVVVGLAAYSTTADGQGSAGGLAVDVAAEAARRGGTVELVGKVGDDGAGDAVVLALGRLGIGHAALLRDPARPTPVLTFDAGLPDEDGPDVEAAELVGAAIDDFPASGRASRRETSSSPCGTWPRRVSWSSRTGSATPL